ncbi:Holliday junction resolvase RuvX [Proteinivorax hydrogeniformans]|uniref:Putative pre-16S rRNA nuclease n=1 Tax=Proteinivorax hydrogeniformans TaxID=1826727 RepID=A0AAU8HRM0_9FIRM
MRVMGLDLGEKTIGVAVSDELKITAQGLTVISRAGKKNDFAKLKEIIDEYKITKVVIGLPKNMDNSIGERGELSIKFKERMEKKFPHLEYYLEDERLTTAQAERQLIEADVSRKGRKKVIDKQAAILILQNFLAKI